MFILLWRLRVLFCSIMLLVKLLIKQGRARKIGTIMPDAFICDAIRTPIG